MISEERLQAALTRYHQQYLDSLPEPEEYRFECSAEVEKKMRRLIRRQKHPVCYQVLRGTLAAVLALVLLFGAVFAVSPEVQAAVMRWLQENLGGSFHYYTETPEPTNPEALPDIAPPQLSDRYRLLETQRFQTSVHYTYLNNTTGQAAKFSYYASGELVLKTEDCGHFTEEINGVTADIYIWDSDEIANVIVWKDTSEELLCCISGFEDKKTLLQMAECVMDQLK